MDQLAVAAQEIAAQVTVGTAEGQLEAEVAGTAVVQVVVEEQTDPVAVVDTGVVAADTAEGQLEVEVAGTAAVQAVVEEQTDPVAVVDTGVVAAGTAEGQLEAAAGLQALALVARWLG